MNNLRTSLNKNSKLLKIILLFICLSFIIGFIIYQKIDNDIIFDNLNNIEELLTNNHINYFIYHFIIISVLITSSLTIIGLLIYPIYLLFEGISISYNLFILTHIYHLKGFIYSLIYIIITKTIFILLLLLILKKILNILKLIISQKDFDFKYTIYKNIKKIIIYIFLIFLNDILIYFLGSMILKNLLFIIS